MKTVITTHSHVSWWKRLNDKRMLLETINLWPADVREKVFEHLKTATSCQLAASLQKKYKIRTFLFTISYNHIYCVPLRWGENVADEMKNSNQFEHGNFKWVGVLPSMESLAWGYGSPLLESITLPASIYRVKEFQLLHFQILDSVTTYHVFNYGSYQKCLAGEDAGFGSVLTTVIVRAHLKASKK